MSDQKDRGRLEQLTNGAWHLWLTFLGEGVALRNEPGLLCSFGGSGWGRLERAEGDMGATGHSEALNHSSLACYAVFVGAVGVAWSGRKAT